MEIPHQHIWTIGHSTHTWEHFLDMIKSFDIKVIADVRNFPGSRKFPQFNKDELKKLLSDNEIDYVHFKDLGGRRNTRVDSVNDGWRLASFRGYADYMETIEFRHAIQQLQLLAAEKKLAYMCAEAVWWRCHRSLISDYLKLEGWTVIHIMNAGKGEEHPYTNPARIVENKLVYSKA
jgi:uncharacterized protein (DUF488 family)